VWDAGYIHLKLPVFHIGFFKQTLSVLSCICKTCSRVVLSESESARFYKAFRRWDRPAITILHTFWKHEQPEPSSRIGTAAAAHHIKLKSRC
jgi:DNA-directed RNA polymerase beta' subunit